MGITNDGVLVRIQWTLFTSANKHAISILVLTARGAEKCSPMQTTLSSPTRRLHVRLKMRLDRKKSTSDILDGDAPFDAQTCEVGRGGEREKVPQTNLRLYHWLFG